MHVLIVGDSHTGALERGRALLASRGELPAGIDWRIQPLGSGRRMNQEFWRREGGAAVVSDPVYRERLAKLPPDDPRPDVIGLSMLLWSGRVLRDLLQAEQVPFGVQAPGRPISTALFHKLVRADMEPALELALFLRDTGIPVLLFEPPLAFREYRFVPTHGAEAVIALQRAIRGYQAEVLAQAGLPAVRVPPDALDAEGFMRPEHAHEDPTDTHHANAAFGARMLLAGVPLIRALAGEGARRAAAG